MRVENWNPSTADQSFEKVAVERLEEAAGVVARAVRRRCPVGTVSRPMYRSGPYAGQEWTARDAGQLKKSVRVVRKKTKSGKAFSKKRNVRIYAGTKNAYYASIVEHSRPFMRPGFEASVGAVKEILGVR
ncbi:MAG: HK97 gp10 family phage protein [Nanoarchaeota archaeon]|nr:HK97 gp10 family phage protein [Nanoarchaeota archaeon]